MNTIQELRLLTKAVKEKKPVSGEGFDDEEFDDEEFEDAYADMYAMYFSDDDDGQCIDIPEEDLEDFDLEDDIIGE